MPLSNWGQRNRWRVEEGKNPSVQCTNDNRAVWDSILIYESLILPGLLVSHFSLLPASPYLKVFFNKPFVSSPWIPQSTDGAY